MSHALLLTVASLASQGPKHEEIHQLLVNHNQETFPHESTNFWVAISAEFLDLQTS
jgi:hypothetical protein